MESPEEAFTACQIIRRPARRVKKAGHIKTKDFSCRQFVFLTSKCRETFLSFLVVLLTLACYSTTCAQRPPPLHTSPHPPHKCPSAFPSSPV